MTGKAGVGFSARLDRGFQQVPVLTFRYWKRAFAFEAIAGFDWDVTAGQLDDTRRFHGGVGALWMIRGSQHISASIGMRAYTQITYRDLEATTVRISVDEQGQTTLLDPLSRSSFDLGLLIAFPLQIEHFLSDHSSITASVALTIVTSSGFETDSGQDSVLDRPFREIEGASMQLAGRYSGGLGYTYYF